MIDGVIVKPLKIIRDGRGQVMHMVRSDDPLFQGFGEIYFSVVDPGIVKGWKKHVRMVQLFAVPRGDMKLVIYDSRDGSPSKGAVQEIVLGESRYQLVRVPSGVWYSFGALGGAPAMIANCASLPHDPQESEKTDLDDQRIPYRWQEPGAAGEP